MRKILQKEDKVLRRIAKEVPVGKITSLEIKKTLREMSAALASQKDGVAIAAPQIGYSLRIFLVSGKIFNKRSDLGDSKRSDLRDSKKYPDLIFINPKILKLSRDKDWLPEGCLSVRWLYGQTLRSKKVRIEAYDEKGKKFTRGAAGLLAQIFQHETDHLNGVLFIDHAKEVKEEKPNAQ
ncbi:hypothetical protein A3G06_01030 [Candidatus Nomurabacteria bacterium RIFCSPLOWO2_12_FULL_46_14]|uniref:Peptide deformylase n=1 Tax=Candidatus Nomurabacteria bacterium RIFCSPLOWO2_12_FULL_46_14 TaxID=1801797 RepID=A0A1F6Y8C6_9BACT|nr:MAG: hypothetical protein A3G06_01030 [Candidatus Nomurabacteria bacterium RIFCSPLOWO2_12_FULL_46_14]